MITPQQTNTLILNWSRKRELKVGYFPALLARCSPRWSRKRELKVTGLTGTPSERCCWSRKRELKVLQSYSNQFEFEAVLISQERIERIFCQLLPNHQQSNQNWSRKRELKVSTQTYFGKLQNFPDLARENWKYFSEAGLRSRVKVTDLARENWKLNNNIFPILHLNIWSRKRELKDTKNPSWQNADFLNWSRKRELKVKLKDGVIDVEVQELISQERIESLTTCGETCRKTYNTDLARENWKLPRTMVLKLFVGVSSDLARENWKMVITQ